MPIVFMDNLKVNKTVNSVYCNGYEGIKQITRHLISLGHKDIAFIKSIARYRAANDRYNGYIDAIKEAGLPFNENIIFEGNYDVKSGFDAAKHFYTEKKTNPTAIVSSTDLMAIGAMNYLGTIGLKIPEDVAIAGFDDIYLSKLVTPPLTTYRQPVEEIAREAVKLLINKNNHPNAKNKVIVLEGKLIVRRSTDSSCKEIVII
jgi:DNA-binding LacI/PurR family transcriptional regulator